MSKQLIVLSLIALISLMLSALVSCDDTVVTTTTTYFCDKVDDSICLRNGWAFTKRITVNGSSSTGILSCHLTLQECLSESRARYWRLSPLILLIPVTPTSVAIGDTLCR